MTKQTYKLRMLRASARRGSKTEYEELVARMERNRCNFRINNRRNKLRSLVSSSTSTNLRNPLSPKPPPSLRLPPTPFEFSAPTIPHRTLDSDQHPHTAQRCHRHNAICPGSPAHRPKSAHIPLNRSTRAVLSSASGKIFCAYSKRSMTVLPVLSTISNVSRSRRRCFAMARIRGAALVASWDG